MKPADIQQFLPLVVAIVFLALMSRRMLPPRRFRVGSLLIAPVVMAVGIGFFLAARAAPSAVHAGGLALALIAGCGTGWARAKLVRLEFDLGTEIVTQRGTPYGIVFLLLLFGLRNFVLIAAANDPKIATGLREASDLLLFFGFGILTGYAVALYYAAIRIRRPAGIATPDRAVTTLD